MAKVYCKWCGREAEDAWHLAHSSSCSKNPHGKEHELYEGSKKSQYTCKWGGRTDPDIWHLANSTTCYKSPYKRHEPAL